MVREILKYAHLCGGLSVIFVLAHSSFLNAGDHLQELWCVKDKPGTYRDSSMTEHKGIFDVYITSAGKQRYIHYVGGCTYEGLEDNSLHLNMTYSSHGAPVQGTSFETNPDKPMDKVSWDQKYASELIYFGKDGKEVKRENPAGSSSSSASAGPTSTPPLTIASPAVIVSATPTPTISTTTTTTTTVTTPIVPVPATTPTTTTTTTTMATAGTSSSSSTSATPIVPSSQPALVPSSSSASSASTSSTSVRARDIRKKRIYERLKSNMDPEHGAVKKKSKGYAGAAYLIEFIKRTETRFGRVDGKLEAHQNSIELHIKSLDTLSQKCLLQEIHNQKEHDLCSIWRNFNHHVSETSNYKIIATAGLPLVLIPALKAFAPVAFAAAGQMALPLVLPTLAAGWFIKTVYDRKKAIDERNDDLEICKRDLGQQYTKLATLNPSWGGLIVQDGKKTNKNLDIYRIDNPWRSAIKQRCGEFTIELTKTVVTAATVMVLVPVMLDAARKGHQSFMSGAIVS